MLYKLLYELYKDQQYSIVFNLFKYVTVRAALAAATAFLISVALGPWLIRSLKRWNVKEKTSKTHSETLAELHKLKEATPTMGGLLILFSVVASTLLWADWDAFYVRVLLFVTIALGAVGFLDDYIKLTHPKVHGLSLWSKLGAQVAVGGIAGVVLYLHAAELPRGTDFTFPFLKGAVSLGAVYVVLVLFVVTGTSNAVNLADGLDGLAGGCAVLVALAIGGMAYIVGHVRFSEYLLIQHVPGSWDMAIYCASLVGACLGFLWFNSHPAQIFMGDTGALAIGGAMGLVSVIIKQEAALVIAGGIFVAEALSVLLQILSFRLTGRRIFRCAPLHHHFQFGGWHENKVIVRFWIIGAILAMAAMATLKLR